MSDSIAFPSFGSYAGDGDTVSIEFDGFTFTATLHHDSDHGAPWDECDGHGPVSDWTTRDKRPGERVLSSDGRSHRFYDVAEATRTAKRDAWGPRIPYRTAGIAAAVAVEADFQFLKSWCDDEWYYVGVAVTVTRDVDGEAIELTGEYDHALWGIESNAGDYLSDVAADLAAEALDAARARAAVIARELA